MTPRPRETSARVGRTNLRAGRCGRVQWNAIFWTLHVCEQENVEGCSKMPSSGHHVSVSFKDSQQLWEPTQNLGSWVWLTFQESHSMKTDFPSPSSYKSPLVPPLGIHWVPSLPIFILELYLVLRLHTYYSCCHNFCEIIYIYKSSC